MSNSNTPILNNRVNAHGTVIRSITMHVQGRVYEFQYQFVNGEWIRFRRVTHNIH
jgi:hypothetical protein